MLELKNIRKERVREGGALRGVDLAFSAKGLCVLLGAGGDTLLRIMAALERSEGGEVLFHGRPRKESAAALESWRGSAAGFVGSGCGLLEGESAFANVEMEMRLGGVDKTTRRRRAAQLIRRVGLGEKANALPRQLSAAERIRADIARALANDPEMLLLSQPLDGLEEKEAGEVIALLRAVAQDRPVIFTARADDPGWGEDVRRITLRDGQVARDSAPPETEESAAAPKLAHPILGLGLAWRIMSRSGRGRRGSRVAASVAVALVTAVLGAAVAVPRAWNGACEKLEDDALSVMPLTIGQETVSGGMVLRALNGSADPGDHPRDAVYAAGRESAWQEATEHAGVQNDLNALLDTLQSDRGAARYLSDVAVEDGTALHIYASDTSLEVRELTASALPGVWAEMSGDRATLERQYDVVAGRWSAGYDELVLFLDENNEVDDLSLRALGLYDGSSERMNYENILSTTYRLLRPTDYYQSGADGRWARIDGDADLLRAAVESGTVLHVVGIVRPSAEASEHCFTGVMGYTRALKKQLAASVEQSAAVQQQRQDPTTDVFTLLPFLPENLRGLDTAGKAAELRIAVDGGLGVAEQMALYAELSGCSQAEAAAMVSSGEIASALERQLQSSSDERCARLYEDYILSGYSTRRYGENLAALGANGGTVTALRLYCDSFADREGLTAWLESYNRAAVRDGSVEKLVSFEDPTPALVSAAATGGRLLRLLLPAAAALAVLLALLTLNAMLRASAGAMRSTFATLSLWGVGAGDAAWVLRLEALLPGLAGGAAGLPLAAVLLLLLNGAVSRLWGVELGAALSWRELLGLPVAALLLTLLSSLGSAGMTARAGRGGKP